MNWYKKTITPPLYTRSAEMNKICHTYYSEIPSLENCKLRGYSQRELIDICSKSWEKNGWEFRVLSEENATSHSFYSQYSEIVQKIPSINPKSYDYHCYMRWLAMANIGGGLMIDYDVMNRGITPELFENTFTNLDQLTIFQDHIPSVVYGTSIGYHSMCEQFCQIYLSNKCIESINNKLHTSDMIMIRCAKNSLHIKCLSYVKYYPANSGLIHCAQFLSKKLEVDKKTMMQNLLDN